MMPQTLNFISTNVQGYRPSETSLFGVSGRSVSKSPCAGIEFKSSQAKIISVKRSLKQTQFVCQVGSGGQRRNPDFSRQNRHVFSRNRNRYTEERDNSENLDESEFVSTKNGPILSLSNSPKANATAGPGQKEREIVELFRKVQAKLRERAVVKDEKKFETTKGQNKESETVDSLLNLLRKHSAEQGKRKVNGGNANEFSFDRPRESGEKANGDKSRIFSRSSRIVKEDPEETQKPSVGRPVSNFRRRSPVPRAKYDPVISVEDTHDSVNESDLDANTNGAYYEPVPDFESESESDDESDLDPELDIASGLELEGEDEQEDEQEEQEEEPDLDLVPEIEFVGKAEGSESSDAKEHVYDEKDTEKEHTKLRDLNDMKIVELRALAKARGMKGYSKLKKTELIEFLSDDSSIH